jgi:hypothetical protein
MMLLWKVTRFEHKKGMLGGLAIVGVKGLRGTLAALLPMMLMINEVELLRTSCEPCSRKK